MRITCRINLTVVTLELAECWPPCGCKLVTCTFLAARARPLLSCGWRNLFNARPFALGQQTADSPLRWRLPLSSFDYSNFLSSSQREQREGTSQMAQGWTNGIFVFFSRDYHNKRTPRPRHQLSTRENDDGTRPLFRLHRFLFFKPQKNWRNSKIMEEEEETVADAFSQETAPERWTHFHGRRKEIRRIWCDFLVDCLLCQLLRFDSEKNLTPIKRNMTIKDKVTTYRKSWICRPRQRRRSRRNGADRRRRTGRHLASCRRSIGNNPRDYFQFGHGRRWAMRIDGFLPTPGDSSSTRKRPLTTKMALMMNCSFPSDSNHFRVADRNTGASNCKSPFGTGQWPRRTPWHAFVTLDSMTMKRTGRNLPLNEWHNVISSGQRFQGRKTFLSACKLPRSERSRLLHRKLDDWATE